MGNLGQQEAMWDAIASAVSTKIYDRLGVALGIVEAVIARSETFAKTIGETFEPIETFLREHDTALADFKDMKAQRDELARILEAERRLPAEEARVARMQRDAAESQTGEAYAEMDKLREAARTMTDEEFAAFAKAFAQTAIAQELDQSPPRGQEVEEITDADLLRDPAPAPKIDWLDKFLGRGPAG